MPPSPSHQKNPQQVASWWVPPPHPHNKLVVVLVAVMTIRLVFPGEEIPRMPRTHPDLQQQELQAAALLGCGYNHGSRHRHYHLVWYSPLPWFCLMEFDSLLVPTSRSAPLRLPMIPQRMVVSYCLVLLFLLAVRHFPNPC